MHNQIQAMIIYRYPFKLHNTGRRLGLVPRVWGSAIDFQPKFDSSYHAPATEHVVQQNKSTLTTTPPKAPSLVYDTAH